MEIQPIKNYPAPRYPDKYTVIHNPFILKTLPVRWTKNAVVITTLTTTVAMMMTGCNATAASENAERTASSGTAESVPSVASLSSALSSATDVSSMPVSTLLVSSLPTSAASSIRSSSHPSSSKTPITPDNPLIAPLFEHGDGRGSFGCMSIAPASFLSEEEALSVITEMLKTESIELSQETSSIKVEIPSVSLDYFGVKDYTPSKAITGYINQELILDGIDVNKKIAFEFISVTDLKNWRDQKVGMSSSVEEYEFKEVAKALNQKLKRNQTDYTVATFYDPHYKFSSDEADTIIKKYRQLSDYKSMEVELKSLVKEDLKLQVQDFIKWLKAQNVI